MDLLPLPFLTHFEQPVVVARRIRQLRAGAPAMVQIDSVDHVQIALEEFNLGLLRGELTRGLPDGSEQRLLIENLNPPSC